MIELTKLNKGIFYLHPDHIQTVEITPDTIITLDNGNKYIVLETAEEISKKMITYYRKIHRPEKN